MAKDPAFLFYSGDWLQGTMGMTFEEKGAYLELLIFQFNNGKFTIAQAKQVLSICSASVFQNVLQKFDTDGKMYWKQRLSDEVEKRKKFTESRRNNAKGHKKEQKQSKAYAKHMENENINENEIDNVINRALNEIYLEQQKPKWGHIDFDFEVNTFKEKVRGSPYHYRNHDTSGLRLAFQSQLRNAKKKFNGTDKQTANLAANIQAFQDRWADKG